MSGIDRVRAVIRAVFYLPRSLAELGAAQAELERRQTDLARAQQTFERERLRALDNFIQSMPAIQRGIARDVANFRGNLASLSDSVGYLLRRVEFVRRELMFEMRYGATAPSSERDQLDAEVKIIAPDKLAVAKADRVRLNLGCGHVPLDGYLNVDRRALPGVDIVAEIDKLPFGPGEVDEIFSAHLVEHFPQEQVRRELLPYWTSLLKSGGEFHAIVPDADGMIKAYAAGEYPFERLREVTFGSQDYDGDFHFNMLTTASLSAMLAEAGLTDIAVIAENRENGGCREFEICARRPEGAR